MDLSFYIYLEMIFAVIVFVLLSFITAPYGRFYGKQWGPSLNARFGWIVMEAPAVILPFYFFIRYKGYENPVLIVFIIIWELHYIQRTVIYPLLLSKRSKPMAVFIPMMAMLFNLLNGYINGFGLYSIHSKAMKFSTEWFVNPRFIIGAAIFLTGFLINLHSDKILRRLKRENDDYVIPGEGLHRMVASPNYFGEILEWCGWAVLTWSLGGLVFALFTMANLIPRAKKQQKWYQERFEDYPANRKAVFPFIF